MGRAFIIITAILIIMTAVVTCFRAGKDLNVGLFGVEQMLARHSPYDNPTDPNRPIYRYAPGFTLLQAPFLLISKSTAAYKFEHMFPSILLWYFAEIIALLTSVLLVLKLFPAFSPRSAMHNIKMSLLLALPFIAYELSNSQNKLIALAFLLAAVYMFEKNKNFFSSLFLSLAMTVYIPLAFFALYFILRSRGKYIAPFILSVVAVFLVIPSLVWGIDYNNFVLKDWYTRCLKPFFMSGSYTGYMELRSSSQSLPSTIGRIFVIGRAEPYKYLISPLAIHIIIKISSMVIIAVSFITILPRVKAKLLGLSYAVFLPLALIIPSYCISYTWAYLFVLYFAVLNYISYPDVDKKEKTFLKIAVAVLVISSYSIAIRPLYELSVMFWGTLFYWGCVTAVMLRENRICRA